MHSQRWRASPLWPQQTGLQSADVWRSWSAVNMNHAVKMYMHKTGAKKTAYQIVQTFLLLGVLPLTPLTLPYLSAAFPFGRICFMVLVMRKRRGEHLNWSLAFNLYIGSFPCAQLPGPVHTARLGRVCFCVFSLGLYFVFLWFVCVSSSWAVESSPLQFLVLV